MKSKKLVSAILAAASIAGGVVGAQAADPSTLEAKVDSYTSRVQQAEKKIDGLQTKVDAIDTTGIANNKTEIEANKAAIATQGAQISQIQQDIAQDAMDRANEMNDLTTKVNQKADKGDVEQNKNDIDSNAAAIQTETQKREDAVKGLQDKLTVANGQIENEKTTRENAVNDLQNQVTANKNTISTQGAQISQILQDMAQDAMDRANEMNDLTTKVNQKADKGDVEQNKNDIASNAAAIQTETQKREDAVKGLQDKLTVANGQIENEKTTRENAVNDLQSQVTANKTATESNAAAIQKETTDRQSAVESLKQQIAAEKNDRIYADKAQDKVIETVNKNMADGFNTINTNVANGFTALNNTDAALQGQITANKGDIADLQHKIVASGQAFNAEQVDQIKTNKDDIGTIFGQLDQGEYNTQDGYAIKKNDTIGGALKNLDKNAEKQGAQISQIQQDMAQDAMDRANEMSDLTAKVNKKADKADVETNKNNIVSNAAAIQKETQKREDAVKGLQDKLTVVNGQIENEKTTRENAVNDLQKQVTANKNTLSTQGQQITQIQKDMAQDAIDRANEMNDLTTKVNQKADKSDVETNKNNIASNAAAIQTETQKREDAVNGLKDQLTITNGRLENEKTTRENADKTLQGNIYNEAAERIAGDNALNSRIGQVESDANKGIAKASALAALHPLDYDPDNKFDIAAAGGFYKGENAFALGAFYRPNRNVMLSMGTTLTSGDNAYNVGLTFKIGKSGKHTEAGLTTADLYAMIGAMQDKMDQQQKKIEELEAKQAK